MKYAQKRMKASLLLILTLVVSCTKPQTPSGPKNELDPEDGRNTEDTKKSSEIILENAKQWADKLSTPPNQVDEWHKTIVAPFSDRLANTKAKFYKKRLPKLTKGLSHIKQSLSKNNDIQHLPENIKTSKAYEYPRFDAYLRLMLRAIGTGGHTGEKLEI